MSYLSDMLECMSEVAALIDRIRELDPVGLLAVREATSQKLAAADLTALSDEQVIEATELVEKGVCRDTTIRVNFVTELRQRSVAGKVNKKFGRWLADLLRLNRSDANALVVAADRIGVGRTMSGDIIDPPLENLSTAITDGAASWQHYRTVEKILKKVPASIAIDPELWRSVEGTLAAYCRTMSPNQVTKVGIRLLAHLNPDGDFTEDRDRKRRRGFTVSPQDVDHMTAVGGEWEPAVRAMWDVLAEKWAAPGMNNPNDPESPSGPADQADCNTIAAAAERDSRTPAQRNHDAFGAMLRWFLSSGALGTHRGLPARVVATMTLDDLESETGVATTASGGTLPVRDALALASAGRPFLALLDNRNRPLFLGRQRRDASPDMRIALIASDRGCTRPGCEQPATRCQVHHIIEWAKGGGTDITALTLVCDSDHANVHDGDGGWITRIIESGALPDGRIARVGWTQRGSGKPLASNDIHHPERDVKLFRQQFRRELDDFYWNRDHQRWHAEARRWEEIESALPPPDLPDWIDELSYPDAA